MTKNDVIDAAFRVWGQELYKTTSLAKLADALLVSKPALYRHFPDKQALLKSMEERFYDDYAAAVKPALDEARKNADWRERILALVEFITGYYARHLDYFVYCMVGFHDHRKDRLFNIDSLESRGVSFVEFVPDPAEQIPSILFLTGITSFFSTAVFYSRGFGLAKGPKAREWAEKYSALPESSKESVRLFSAETAERVRNGLCFNRAIVEKLRYAELERTEDKSGVVSAPSDPLLKAVAEVVAEAGPWNASMKEVARRSGLSKSGLYAHFINKGDMLSRLFMSEFDRIAHCGALRSKAGKNREEQLYLAMLSIADYLQKRPEIIIALDWVRIQQVELDISVPVVLHDFFTNLGVDGSSKGFSGNISQWILLMLVTVLKHYCAIDTRAVTERFDYRILRRLFQFICLGLNGLE